MKKAVFYVALMISSLLISCGGNSTSTKKTNYSDINADSIALADSIAQCNDIIEFITDMYNNRKYEDYDFIKKHCSSEMLNVLKEEFDYECEDGDCYAVWLFRSSAQDGPNDKNEIISVKPIGDYWYKYDFYDMGIRASNIIKVIKKNGKIIIESVQYLGFIDNEGKEVDFTSYNDDDNKAYLSCPDNNHPHPIDLGLPSGTKWACCNVDASTPEGYGGYYAWGETKEKDVYDLSTYIYCDGSDDTYHDLGSDIAGTKYDVAHVKWGGDWNMPSLKQFQELRDNCTYEWATQNGVEGGKFIGSNSGSIFLPAAGYRWGSEIGGASNYGYYGSSLGESKEGNVYYLFLSDSNVDWGYNFYRHNGLSVRPVR